MKLELERKIWLHDTEKIFFPFKRFGGGACSVGHQPDEAVELGLKKLRMGTSLGRGRQSKADVQQEWGKRGGSNICE